MKYRKIYIVLFVLIHLIYSCENNDDGERITNIAVTASTAKITSDKLNILYVGINNPIQITTSDFINEKIIKITGNNNTIEEISENNYIATIVDLSDNIGIEVLDGEILVKKEVFRSKRVPDPFISLESDNSNSISSNQFRSFSSLSDFTFPNNFKQDYPDVSCNVASFTITKIGSRTDAVEVTNNGSNYSAASSQLITQAKPGDFYLFTNIKVSCSGDKANRSSNSLVYKIK